MVPDVAESIKFYREAFGAEELYSSILPDGSVVHAQVKIADSVLLLTYENLGSQDAAVPGEDPGTTPRSPHSLGGTTTILEMYVDDVDTSFKKAVGAGGKPAMPVTDMFFGDRYGWITDPSGHVWALATVKEELTPAEVELRVIDTYSQTSQGS